MPLVNGDSKLAVMFLLMTHSLASDLEVYHLIDFLLAGATSTLPQASTFLIGPSMS